MENAASAAAEVIERRFPRARRVAIACGGGNNGGDGLALARQLATRGVAVSVLLCAREDDLRGDAAVQLRALRASDGRRAPARDSVVELRSIDESSLDAARARAGARGSGGRCAVRHRAHAADRRVARGAGGRDNAARAPRLALDVPSGLDASSSETPGPHVARRRHRHLLRAQARAGAAAAGAGGRRGVVGAAGRAGARGSRACRRACDW